MCTETVCFWWTCVAKLRQLMAMKWYGITNCVLQMGGVVAASPHCFAESHSGAERVGVMVSGAILRFQFWNWKIPYLGVRSTASRPSPVFFCFWQPCLAAPAGQTTEWRFLVGVLLKKKKKGSMPNLFSVSGPDLWKTDSQKHHQMCFVMTKLFYQRGLRPSLRQNDAVLLSEWMYFGQKAQNYWVERECK